MLVVHTKDQSKYHTKISDNQVCY